MPTPKAGGRPVGTSHVLRRIIDCVGMIAGHRRDSGEEAWVAKLAAYFISPHPVAKRPAQPAGMSDDAARRLERLVLCAFAGDNARQSGQIKRIAAQRILDRAQEIGLDHMYVGPGQFPLRQRELSKGRRRALVALRTCQLPESPSDPAATPVPARPRRRHHLRAVAA